MFVHVNRLPCKSEMASLRTCWSGRWNENHRDREKFRGGHGVFSRQSVIVLTFLSHESIS